MSTQAHTLPIGEGSLEGKPQGVYAPERWIGVSAWLATGLAVMIYCLVSLGGLVRSAGAGLSCPDWPLCHGQAVPAQMFQDGLHATNEATIPGKESPVPPHATAGQIFLEWFHRMVAGGVSIGLLALSILIFRSQRMRRELGAVTGLAIAMLAAQVVLGGLTVLGLLSPKWVVSHLVVGLAFFSSLLWISMTLHQMRRGRAFGGSPAVFASVAFIAIFVQIFLGGLVSSNYAGLACEDFPTCHGQWLAPFQGGEKFQQLHRFGAYAVTLILLSYFFSIRKQVSSVSSKIAWVAIPFLLAAQVSLGAGMIWFQIPLLMSVAHLAVAAAILACTVILLFHLRNAEGQVQA